MLNGFSFGRNAKSGTSSSDTPAVTLVNPSEVKYAHIHALLGGQGRVTYETQRGSIRISEHGDGLSLCFTPNSRYANKNFPEFSEIHYALNSNDKGYMWEGYFPSHFRSLYNLCEELITSKKANEELLKILHPSEVTAPLPLDELEVPSLRKAV